jgi:hypothetical protein
MPGLAGLMQKAFGTQSVEAIRDMGISGKEFVKQITAAASELPRVEGGIKNGIGNAMDSLKQSAAKVGLAINEAFNVTGIIEGVSSSILFLAQGFASLDGFSQKVILTFGGLLVAVGPVVKAWGAIQLLGSQLVSGWGALVGAGKYLAAGLQTIRNAFIALNVATQAFILIGVITAVTALSYAFINYQSALSNTEKAAASLAAVQSKAVDSIQGQKTEVETLVSAYKAEGATLTQKAAILKELNRISPEYFGAIKTGKGDIEAITRATKAYGAELLRVAEINSLKGRLEEISTGLRNVTKDSDPSALQTLWSIVKSGLQLS